MKSENIKILSANDTIEKYSKEYVQRNFFDMFDWKKPNLLKQKLISDFTHMDKRKDVLLTRFLEDYNQLIKEFNNILFALPNYDSLNTLIYQDTTQISSIALDFENQVITHDLKIRISEALIVIAPSTTYIKSQTLNYLDPVSIKFLNLYCYQIDNICCEDAGLIISASNLVNRIYDWGELSKEVSKMSYAYIVEDHFKSNLYLLFEGPDNSPSFDRVTHKYNQHYFKLMTDFVESNPKSRAAEKFGSYIKILTSENFEKTKVVSEYLDDIFK